MAEETERRAPERQPEKPAGPPEKPRPKVPFVLPPPIYDPDKAIKVEWPAWRPERERDKV